jgi:hypothetical protein
MTIKKTNERYFEGKRTINANVRKPGSGGTRISRKRWTEENYVKKILRKDWVRNLTKKLLKLLL